MGDAADVGEAPDEALGEQEADGEETIFARAAHGDRERVASEADLERLLDRDRVALPERACRAQTRDGALGHAALDHTTDTRTRVP